MSKHKKRRLKKRTIIILIMAIVCILASVFSIYSLSLLSGIESFLRITLSAIIAILMMSFLLGFFHSLKKKSKKYLFYIPVVLVYSIVLIGFGYYVMKTYSVLDKFTTDATTYSSSLVTLKENKVNDLSGVKGKIGIIKDEDNIIGNTIPNEVIKNRKLDVKTKEYDTYIDLLNALYDKEVDYVFLPTGYVVMFSTYEGQDFSSLADDTKIIHTEEKSVKTKASKKSNTLDKPFTILLMGVDSAEEELSSSAFNGDSLMLITFNPDTLNTTMLSIPRDTYVPITCFANQAKSKITHAAWYGEECMINTIENFTGIDIDYYVKINFKGVVKIVDTLDGVEVDVPYSFCESDSSRRFGNNTIYINQGLQTLNGEQALAFSRNRHTWPEYCGKAYSNYISNDFVRGQNQQTVVKAILNKIKQKGDLGTVYKLLDVVSSNMETNMTTNEILSLYNIGKDVISKSTGSNVDDVIGMQKLYLSGYGTMDIYDVSMGMYLYNYVLYQESLDAVVNAMKINLGLAEPTMEKEFSFDIDEEYEQVVIGKRSSGTPVSFAKNTPKKNTQTNTNSNTNTNTSTNNQTKVDDKKDETVEVPNFVGMTYSQAKSKANSLGLYLNVGSVTNNDAIVETQDTSAGRTVNKGVTIKLTFKVETKDDDDDNVVKNKCVKESDVYYWYDADGNKNLTKYSDATCSTEVTNNDPEPDNTNND